MDTDQRGGNFFETFARIVDGVIDIGAVEVQDPTAGGGLVVNSFGDTADLTDDVQTLREAIIAANGRAGADTITLAAGTYVLDLAGAGEDDAATGDLDITDALTIVGAGSGQTIIDASALSDRVFEIFTATVSITGVTITGGSVAGDGGGLANRGGTVTLDDVRIDDNAANGDGAGIAGSGGGIFNDGTLTATGSFVSGNTARRAGGGVEVAAGAVTTLDDVDLIDNSVAGDPAPGNGGGLHISGTGMVTILGGNITGNTAVEGGGVWNSGAGRLTIGLDADGDGTRISGNDAVRGGGVYNDTSADVQTFTADLQTLNAAYGSTATGTATLTMDTSGVTTDAAGVRSGIATIRVQINATGLQDLTGVPGGVHVAHIHGQFAGNASRPLAQQGDGPFFDGAGGVAVNSALPTTAGDGALNVDETDRFGAAEDYLDFFEGRPQYGPVVLNLTAEQLESAPDGVAPLNFFFAEVMAGRITPTDQFPSGTEFVRDTVYSFDLSDPDAARQFNNLNPLSTREIVLHGLLIPTEISDAIDAATNAAPGSPTAGVPIDDGDADPTNDQSFRRTAPVAAGEIVAASGVVSITGANINANRATGDAATDGGAGVFNAGAMTIIDTEISGNSATAGSASGGGIFNAGGQLELIDSEVTGNLANRAGGGIETSGSSTTSLTNVNLDGNTAGLIGAAMPGNGGGLHVTGPGTVTITGGTVENNAAAAEGGGLWNSSTGTMTVADVFISDNTASGDDATMGGGGLYNDGGSVTLTGGSVVDNEATGDAGSGGGIFNAGQLTATGTAITGNTAVRAGGGIEAIGGSTTRLVDTDLSTNTATGVGAPGNGGGLHAGGDAVVELFGGSVSGNTAVEGGGLWISGTGTLTTSVLMGTTTGTAIADNTATGADPDQGGGGIYNVGGAVTLSGGSITGNMATGAAGSGGGIFHGGGMLMVSGVSIVGNTANRAGGGIETRDGSTARIAASNLTNNVAGPAGSAMPGNGGGLHVTGDGDVTFVGGSVAGNTAANEGGGLWNGAGEMSVNGTTIRDNTASGAGAANGGGGIFNLSGLVSLDTVLVAGNTADGLAGSGGGVLNLGTLTAINSTFAGNVANRAGGAIETVGGTTVTLDRVTIGTNADGTDDAAEANSVAGAGANPGNGGGLHIGGDGVVTINDSSIRGNAAVEGGGLWNSPAGTLTVTRSLIADNTATTGGGVYNEADNTGAGGTVSLVNTTISGNTATGSGGGVFTAGGDVSHVSVTIALNTAADGGGVFAGGGEVTADNTVVSQNTGGDVSGDLTGGVGNLVGGDPQLAPLAFNGGPTMTHLPAATSPLVDAGVNSASAGLDTDQRGGNFFETFARIVDGVIDIGAVEVQDINAGGGLVVNSFGDTADLNDGLRTLREAIIAANANPGADTITLAAGTYVLGNMGAGEDAAATGDLDITDALTIIGAGMEDTIIDASGLDDRAFEIFRDNLVTVRFDDHGRPRDGRRRRDRGAARRDADGRRHRGVEQLRGGQRTDRRRCDPRLRRRDLERWRNDHRDQLDNRRQHRSAGRRRDRSDTGVDHDIDQRDARRCGQRQLGCRRPGPGQRRRVAHLRRRRSDDFRRFGRR